MTSEQKGQHDSKGLPSAGKKKHYHVRTWVFCGLLVLALAGMGLTMLLEKGGWALNETTVTTLLLRLLQHVALST